MSNQNISTIPNRVTSPVNIDCEKENLLVWSGPATLGRGAGESPGNGKIELSFFRRPKFTFDHDNPDLQESQFADLVEMSEDSNREAEIEFEDFPGSHATVISRTTWKHHSGELVSSKKQSSQIGITSAKFLVINGPTLRGEAIRSGGALYVGRLRCKLDDFTLTLDKLPSCEIPKEKHFRVTHVVEIKFSKPTPACEIAAIHDVLFFCLSFSYGRWVGLAGPWAYREENLVEFVPYVTKTSSLGVSHTWSETSITNIFEKLFLAVFLQVKDKSRIHAIRAGIHWSVESSLCAGGIEGAIILQQAGMEAIAWHDLVQSKRLYTANQFKQSFKTASEKIKCFADFYSINYEIPEQCDEIKRYASDNKLNDMIDVMANVRNALIHGTPHKVERIFDRDYGNEERSQLWYQLGGILEQMVLAICEYDGKIAFRDHDVKYKIDAVADPPWIEGEGQTTRQP